MKYAIIENPFFKFVHPPEDGVISTVNWVAEHLQRF